MFFLAKKNLVEVTTKKGREMGKRLDALGNEVPGLCFGGAVAVIGGEEIWVDGVGFLCFDGGKMPSTRWHPMSFRQEMAGQLCLFSYAYVVLWLLGRQHILTRDLSF
ncbi:hypothetical protein LIER_19376 [Lithospermum erythrorhizon]|uniref:Uncharacterized protein n=1 Tax=Lithospermum erythrorhizon TaxID=34254 RepID=A0AAV3QLB3_LITER